MTECKSFQVGGRVQGVFFRASARQRAEELGLTGWVRNCPDGGVEGLACGAPDALAMFRDWLWQGPEQARVTRVEMSPSDRAPPPEFEIR